MAQDFPLSNLLHNDTLSSAQPTTGVSPLQPGSAVPYSRSANILKQLSDENPPDFDSEDFRDLGDVDAARKAIFAQALQAAGSLEPISNNRYTLSLKNVKFTGPDKVSKADHKKAIMQNTYLSRKMYGDWVLTDNATGKEVGHRRAVIAHIPYLTPLGTFAKNGNDYVMSHQLRLRPGIYTRWQDNGELEAHVNATGGLGHRIYMEPETGLFKIKFQQSSLPASDVLKILGATDEQLQEAWGKELYQTNMNKSDPKALNKLYQKLTHNKGKADNPADKVEEIKASFAKLQLDPEVSMITLGKPYDRVGVDTILDTTKKLVDINKGLRDTDSRDNTTFQSVWGPEDLIAEKLADGNKVLRKYLWKVSTNGNLAKIPGGVFDKTVESALIGSGLGMPIEEINPIEIMDGQYRVTRMGEGGISSLTAVPDSARNVHPSQLGFIDVLRTPESMKVGVDARFVNTLKKGKDKKIYTPVVLPNGKRTWKSAQDVNNSVVAFPGEMNSDREFVAALVHGEMRMVPREEVEYSIPHMQNTIHAVGSMVPMTSAVKGQRAVMASRMLTQALPLENPEAPLVQNGILDEDDMSYEEKYGTNLGAIKAKAGGTVLSVDKDKIIIRTPEGKKEEVELYNDFIFNRKTGLTQTPVVQPGDKIEPGQLLARSNYTNDKGASAVGLNARVAFLPFQGKNWEDGFVVSESFAKRATSTHYYKNKLPITDNTITGKQKFISLRPGVYTKEQLARFDDNGVIQPGMEVRTGDPLILAVTKNEPTEAQRAKGRRTSYKDASITWDHHDNGVVTDVFSSPKGTQVIVKTKSQLQIADKLSGRQGNKGVVSDIIPDDQLPTLPDGSKPEVLISPLSLVSRVNPAMVLEAQLGKIAKLTGKRYSIKDFDSIDDLTEFVQKELDKYGLTSNEDLTDTTDPDNPKTIPQVLTGNMFIMKLMHTSESKGQSRGLAGYTSDMQPSKGGSDGAKRMGVMELNALLGNGALNNIVDMKYVKGQENTDYWRQYMAGFNPPTPKIPYVYSKFINYLKGAGINVVREGPRLQLMALTNKDIDTLCENREITGNVDPRTGLKTVSTVAWDDNMKTVKGGLFDDTITGGHNGNKWSFIRLDTKLPNPVMEQPLRLMLGLTEKKFRDIMSGQEKTPYGTGPEAIYQMASKLDIDSEIEKARMDIASGRKTFRDSAVRRIGYLKTAKRLNQSPTDWFTEKVPVLPPFFRPVSQMGANGLPLVSDPNYLYKDLFDTNQAYKYNKKYFGADDSGNLALTLYDSFKAVTGLGEPVTKELKQKHTNGLLKSVFGTNPKFGMVQRQLISTPVDMSGRGVIAPNPDMDMDTCGIPENLAWDVYKTFVIRRLRQHGRSGIQALEEVRTKSKAARDALQAVMEERPVLINRAPTLHKFNMVAQYPKLTKGDHIQLSPFICRGMNADFDGDAMQFHVPTTKAAVEEAATKLLPSHNLLSPGDFTAMPIISKDHLTGLNELTRVRNPKTVQTLTFATKADAIRAYKQGRVPPTARVKVLQDD